jgi:hypothetical protein
MQPRPVRGWPPNLRRPPRPSWRRRGWRWLRPMQRWQGCGGRWKPRPERWRPETPPSAHYRPSCRRLNSLRRLAQVDTPLPSGYPLPSVVGHATTVDSPQNGHLRISRQTHRFEDLFCSRRGVWLYDSPSVTVKTRYLRTRVA